MAQNELKNRAPQYQHISRNVYSKGVARPKRQPRDDIHVCSCHLPCGLVSALPARQPTQRQAKSTLHKQMLQRAAASAAAGATLSNAVGLACPSQTPGAQGLLRPAPSHSPGSACDVRMTDNAADHAIPAGANGSLGGTPCDTGLVEAAQGSGAEASPHAGDAPVREAVESGCGEDCLNRLSFIHCDPKLCPCGSSCSNRSVPMTVPPVLASLMMEMVLSCLWLETQSEKGNVNQQLLQV